MALLLPIKKVFNPAEARDDHGKWTSGGGVGAAQPNPSPGFHQPISDNGKGSSTTPSSIPISSSHLGPFQAPWFESGTPSDAQIHAQHRVTDKVDVDLLIAANPPKPGEELFQWQGRVVGKLDPQTKNDVLAVWRESYPPVDYIAAGAKQWRASHNLPEPKVDIGAQTADLDKAAKVARAFDTTPDMSTDPYVQACYDDFKKQSQAQWDFATKPVSQGGLGIKVDFSPYSLGDPYPSAEAQAEDLRRNHHMTTQSGLGGHHDASMTTEEYNRFRAVHDIFGHAGVGRGFDRHGEYDAWLEHMTMYTGMGRNAMTSEYHGVNSSLWDSTAVGMKYPGTGKTVILPKDLLADPWDDKGNLVRKDTPIDPSVIQYLGQQLHLGPEFKANFERVGFHPPSPLYRAQPPVAKEAPGHAFRGNQYQAGQGGTASPDQLSRHVATQPMGFTMDPKSASNVKSGWVVAHDSSKSLLVSPEDFTTHGREILTSFRNDILASQKASPDSPIKFGGWFDTAHNEWVLDQVEVHPNTDTGRDTAVALGKERDQQSVFHIDSMTEVPTGGTGGRDQARRFGGESTGEPTNTPNTPALVTKRLLPVLLG